ncbi:hypothetical protein LDL59_07895 [Kaistella anthropi]|nr:hypothetical protein [Kaistella anthropi]
MPLLFALAFIYMINAKNKEITKTNLEIEQMVAEIKKIRSHRKTLHKEMTEPRFRRKIRNYSPTTIL